MTSYNSSTKSRSTGVGVVSSVAIPSFPSLPLCLPFIGRVLRTAEVPHRSTPKGTKGLPTPSSYVFFLRLLPTAGCFYLAARRKEVPETGCLLLLLLLLLLLPKKKKEETGCLLFLLLLPKKKKEETGCLLFLLPKKKKKETGCFLKKEEKGRDWLPFFSEEEEGRDSQGVFGKGRNRYLSGRDTLFA